MNDHVTAAGEHVDTLDVADEVDRRFAEHLARFSGERVALGVLRADVE
jgi:hypothetical protein